jgi:hypothetical protein
VQEALAYVNDKAESIVSTRAAATAAQERAKARGVAHPDSLSTIAITVARGHGYRGANVLRAEERLLHSDQLLLGHPGLRGHLHRGTLHRPGDDP